MPEKIAENRAFGLFVSGLVMDKGSYKSTNSGETYWQLHVGVPGQRGTMQITVPHHIFESRQIMDKYESQIALSSMKDGRSMFSEVSI